MKAENAEKISVFLKKSRSGLTLVELIVVITILAILGIIAFMSISGFSKNARDSSRVTDIANLSKSLDITFVRKGSYPDPDNSFQVTYSWGILWSQGTVGNKTIDILFAAGGKLSRKPVDPLTAEEYAYSKLAFWQGYQIKTIWEGESIAYDTISKALFIDKAYASANDPTITYIKGTYNETIAGTFTWAIVYILAIPSLFIDSNASTDILDVDNIWFYINMVSGTGGILYTPKIVWSWSTYPTTDAQFQTIATNVALAYTGTVLATDAEIQPFITAQQTGDAGILASLGKSLFTSSTSVANTDNVTTFFLSSIDATVGTSVTITHNCTVPPTSYASSNTAVATIAGTTITAIAPGTTSITPVGGNCNDNLAKPLTVTTAFVCGSSTVTDSDGNIYNTVSIATWAWSQCWMASNMRVGHLLTGSTMPSDNNMIEKWWYENSADWFPGPLLKDIAIYGGLYTWKEAMNYSTVEGAQGICPSGWHIPRDSEWKTLIEAQATASCESAGSDLYKCSPAASKLAGGPLWSGTITTGAGFSISWSGFNVQPSGFRDSAGQFYNRDAWTMLPSSTAGIGNWSAWFRVFNRAYQGVNRQSGGILSEGHPIRCIKWLGADVSSSSPLTCIDSNPTAESFFTFINGKITGYNTAWWLNVTIPCTIGGSAVTTISDYAFYNKWLTGVTIPNSVITIGSSAFESNPLTKVTIPSRVTTIGNKAFSDNSFTGVTIPNSVTTIGSYAFYSNKLATATIGTGVTSIGDYAFARNLLTGVTIPSGVTAIRDGVFNSNSIASITIPSSVTSIWASSFGGNLLAGVTIPNSVTTIGSYAFYTNKLATATIGTGVTTIGEAAFSNNLLTGATIPNSVTTIGNLAFSINSLTRVNITSSVTSIGTSAFGNQYNSVGNGTVYGPAVGSYVQVSYAESTSTGSSGKFDRIKLPNYVANQP